MGSKVIDNPEVYNWEDKKGKDHLMCAIPVGEAGYSFSFGMSKAEAIVENIDFIEAYVKDNGGRLPMEPEVHEGEAD